MFAPLQMQSMQDTQNMQKSKWNKVKFFVKQSKSKPMHKIQKIEIKSPKIQEYFQNLPKIQKMKKYEKTKMQKKNW